MKTVQSEASKYFFENPEVNFVAADDAKKTIIIGTLAEPNLFPATFMNYKVVIQRVGEIIPASGGPPNV